LCASVCNKLNLQEKIGKILTTLGRKSSLPAAKLFYLIAVANTSAGIKVTDGSSRLTAFGNSSPGA
jgi:hypothetical protein